MSLDTIVHVTVYISIKIVPLNEKIKFSYKCRKRLYEQYECYRYTALHKNTTNMDYRKSINK